MSDSECKDNLDRRVLGELGNSDPISPTANLRLLTTLASSLKNAETPQQSGSTSQSSSVTPQEGCLKFVSRKEKSLSLLCNKLVNVVSILLIKKLFFLNDSVIERKSKYVRSSIDSYSCYLIIKVIFETFWKLPIWLRYSFLFFISSWKITQNCDKSTKLLLIASIFITKNNTCRTWTNNRYLILYDTNFLKFAKKLI